jgi:dihydrolipoamide dehydrogenase
MATLWKQLGTDEITIIQRGARLIPRYEPFACDLLKSTFEQKGITVLTETTAGSVERKPDGGVRLSLSNGKTVLADHVLVATGRLPNTHDIGLESVGLKPGTWLDVDDSMRVKEVPGGWLYAAGDANHRALLTHMGKYQARVCGDVIAARAQGRPEATTPDPWTQYSATADTCAVPQVIFSDPELASVGLTEAGAKARGMNVRAVDYEIGGVAGAELYADGYKGHARIVIDQTRGVLVGMTLIGPAVGELIHAATIAIVGAVPISKLWHAVPSFPTISEIWLRLLETAGL